VVEQWETKECDTIITSSMLRMLWPTRQCVGTEIFKST